MMVNAIASKLMWPVLLGQSAGDDASFNVEAMGQAGAGAGASPLEVMNGAFRRLDILTRPDELVEGLSAMHTVWASVFLVTGVFCVLNGYRWHKRVVIVCAFLSGLGLGHLLAQQIGQTPVVMGAVGLLCAIVAMPMLRVAVAIFGGMTGAFLGANVATLFTDLPEPATVGAVMGFITVGLISFTLYRPVVVLFTSVGGAAMAVAGALTLMLRVPGWYDAIHNSLTQNEMLIPLLVAISGAIGLVLQQQQVQEDSGAAKAKAA